MMRKINYLFIFTLLVLSCPLRAQQGAQDTKFGIKAGLNLSVINNTINLGATEKLGSHFGIYLETKLGKHSALQPELVYSNQGCKTTLRTGEDNGKIALNYLNLALLLKLYASKGFYFTAGPQAGLLMSAKETYRNTGSNPSTGETDISGDIKSLDIALSLGLGYQFEKGFNMGLRYNGGLSNTNNNADMETFRKSAGIGKMTNRVIQLSVGYSF